MATPEQISELRLKIAEPNDVAPWTSAVLSDVIDATGSLDAAAAEVWRGKAAAVAHLVNISEGGSSRSTGDLYKNYTEMANVFEDQATDGAGVRSASRTRKMVRA